MTAKDKETVNKMNEAKAKNKERRELLYKYIKDGKIAVPSPELTKMSDNLDAVAKIKLPAFLNKALGWSIPKARKLVDEIGLDRSTPLSFVVREPDFWTSVETYASRVAPKTANKERLYNGWFLDEECSFLLPELRDAE